MKFMSQDDNFSLFIFNLKKFDMDNINECIKNLVYKLKNTYKKNISGFYNVNVFINDKIGVILDFDREDDFDFFKDVVDLNVIVNDESKIYLKFNDLFLLNKFDNVYFLDDKYYVNVDDVSLREFYAILEDSEIIYGDKANEVNFALKVV